MSKLFQTSLFGYSKKAVNEYISKNSEEFSKKLLEKEMAHKKELEMLQSQVECLTKENEQLRGNREEVADALISAKNYAACLKQQAEADNEEKRRMNEVRQEAQARRIENISEHISSLQQEFRSALERMDRELSSYKETFEGILVDALPQTDVTGQKNLQSGEET